MRQPASRPLPSVLDLMKLPVLLLPCLFLILPSNVPAQTPAITPDSPQWEQFFDPPFTEPAEIPRANPLRKHLFDMLRPPLEEVAGQPILFSGNLRAFKNWAFFLSRTVTKDGSPFASPDGGSSDTIALWIRTVDGWRLVNYDGGATDATFLYWPDMYGVPVELIRGE